MSPSSRSVSDARGQRPPSVDAAAAPTGRHAPWYMLAVMTAVNAVNWADRQVVPILFPGIRAEIALTDTQLGIIGGLAFSLVYSLTSFGFGYASDRTVRRNIVIVGLTVWSAATAASGLATGFWSLFIARFFTGVGEASLYPAAMSLIAERFPVHARGRAIGIFGAAAAVGGGLGVGLGGYIAQTAGWRNVFFWYGAAGLLLVPLLMTVPEARRDASGENSAEPPRRVLADIFTDVRLLAVWAAGVVMMIAAYGYGSWVPSFFVRERGFDVAASGYLFGAAAIVGGIVGSIFGGTLSDRFRRRRVGGELDVSACAAILAAPLIALVIASTSLPALVVGGLVGPVMIYAFFPPLNAVIADIVPPRRIGLAYAVNILFLAGLGQGLGPYLLGFVSDATGSLTTAIAVAIVMMVVASALAVVAGRVVRARTRGGSP